MNVQTIFDALDEDMGNFALGVICGELERQGYEIAINGQSVTSDGFFNDEFNQLERERQPLDVSLYKKATLEQEFSIEFTDYHKIRIGQKINPGDSQVWGEAPTHPLLHSGLIRRQKRIIGVKQI